MLPCQKCGYDNELGRIFCHRCGQKLDLDSIKPVSRGGKSLKRKGKSTLGKLFLRGVELMVLLVILYMVYLMLQVVPSPGKPSEVDTAVVDKKWMALEKLAGGKKAGFLEFSSAEVDAKVNAVLPSLKIEKKDMKWGFVPEQIWIKFTPVSVDMSILATMRLGGALEKKVCFSYSGAPKIQDGGFKFEVKGGSVGKLNWPLGMVETLGFHERAFGEVFRRLTAEKEVLSQLSQIEIRADRAIVYYQPR